MTLGYGTAAALGRGTVGGLGLWGRGKNGRRRWRARTFWACVADPSSWRTLRRLRQYHNPSSCACSCALSGISSAFKGSREGGAERGRGADLVHGKQGKEAAASRGGRRRRRRWREEEGGGGERGSRGRKAERQTRGGDARLKRGVLLEREKKT